MAAAHCVKIVQVQVLADGTIKTDNNMTIAQKITSNSQFRVQPKTGIASSANYPTIEDYVEAEGAIGFYVVHLGQTYIVTYKP